MVSTSSSLFSSFAVISSLALCLFVLRWFLKREKTTKPSLLFQVVELSAFVLSWYSVSIFMTLFNKWFLKHWHTTGFPFPLSMSCLHMFLKFAMSRLLVHVQHHPPHQISKKDYWKLAVPIGLFTAADIALSNLSLAYVTVTFYTIVKSGSNVWNLLFSLGLGLQKPSFRLFFVVVLICTGIALASYGSVDFVFIGFIFVLSASIIGTLRWVLTQYLLKEIRDEPNGGIIAVIYHISPASAAALLPVVLIVDATRYANSDIFDDISVVLVSFSCIAAGGILAFLLIILEIQLVKMTSALSLGIAGNFKDILQIVSAVLIFGDHLSPINSLGLVLAFVGLLLYTFLKHHNHKDHEAAEYDLVRKGDSEYGISDDETDTELAEFT